MTAGMFIQSIWSIGPKVTDFKTTTRNMSKYLESIELTPGQLNDQIFDQYVPSYNIESLAPNIPTYSATYHFQPAVVARSSSNLPSLTSMLISEAKNLKTNM